MNSIYKALTLKKQITDGRYTIVDADGATLFVSSRLFDAALILRFLIGKSMSRSECDFATGLLRDFDEKQQG